MKTLVRVVLVLTALSSIVGVTLLNGQAQAQTLAGEALVKALGQGGYVIVMRHASSPRQVPDKQSAVGLRSRRQGRSGAGRTGQDRGVATNEVTPTAQLGGSSGALVSCVPP